MKLITLNTHSLVEPGYENKLKLFAEAVLRERPDVIALQEVNQISHTVNTMLDIIQQQKIDAYEQKLQEQQEQKSDAPEQAMSQQM